MVITSLSESDLQTYNWTTLIAMTGCRRAIVGIFTGYPTLQVRCHCPHDDIITGAILTA